MKAVNLIPSEHRRARPSGKGSGGAYAVIGVLAVLLLMVVGYMVTNNSLKQSESRAAAAQQEADALEAQAQQLGSFTDFASIKDQRLASVMTTAQTRFDWERFMRELALVMPEGSWLQDTQASVFGDGDSAAGAAPATASTVPTVNPSATLVGCTPKQTDVATMMKRLEQLHRVSEVSLNESVREPGLGAVSLDNCGSYYKFDLTVSFEPVPPAKEAPRGAATVPAKLGGGS
jgi:Tfp pilus assembly protein PilN